MSEWDDTIKKQLDFEHPRLLERLLTRDAPGEGAPQRSGLPKENTPSNVILFRPRRATIG
jgi:hypothetical protein